MLKWICSNVSIKFNWYIIENCLMHSSNQKKLSIIQTIHILYEKSLIIHHFQSYEIYEKQWLCPTLWIVLFLNCDSMFHESITINNDFCVWIYSMHNNSRKVAIFHQIFKQIILIKWLMNYWFWWVFCSNNHSEFFVISVIHRETYCTMIFIIFAKFYHLFFSIQ